MEIVGLWLLALGFMGLLGLLVYYEVRAYKVRVAKEEAQVALYYELRDYLRYCSGELPVFGGGLL